LFGNRFSNQSGVKVRLFYLYNVDGHASACHLFELFPQLVNFTASGTDDYAGPGTMQRYLYFVACSGYFNLCHPALGHISVKFPVNKLTDFLVLD
jgi:hypothetical protein